MGGQRRLHCFAMQLDGLEVAKLSSQSLSLACHRGIVVIFFFWSNSQMLA
jgi:hypothetical protein